jgi:ketosteroid isomerase-like protein
MTEAAAQAAEPGSTAQLVRAFLEALPADLPAAVERYGAPTIQWALPATVPGGGRPWVGKPAVKKFLTMMQAGFEPGSMRLTVHELVCAGPRAAARLSISARSAKGGRQYDNDYAFFVSCQNGQIIDVLEYVDTAKVLAVFG